MTCYSLLVLVTCYRLLVTSYDCLLLVLTTRTLLVLTTYYPYLLQSPGCSCATMTGRCAECAPCATGRPSVTAATL
jgi:hypothetical protein